MRFFKTFRYLPFLFFALLLIACGEAETDQVSEPVAGSPVTIGTLKQPEAVPAAPQAPPTDGTPYVAPGLITLSNATITENEAVGAIIGKLSHSRSGFARYRLTDDAAATLFSIDVRGHLKTKVRFNYEERSVYTVEIEETRTRTRGSFEIQVLDAKDPPTDLQLTHNTFYKEDGVGTKIGGVVVIDEDVDDTYSIEVVEGGTYVGFVNGALAVLSLFDVPQKEIAIEVRDSGGLSYKKTFWITIQNRYTPDPEPSSDPEPANDPEPEPSGDPEPRPPIFDGGPHF